ncbi:hypothetical protein MBLNU459_g5547t2 [Dothideomycetes sp. NU459]
MAAGTIDVQTRVVKRKMSGQRLMDLDATAGSVQPDDSGEDYSSADVLVSTEYDCSTETPDPLHDLSRYDMSTSWPSSPFKAPGTKPVNSSRPDPAQPTIGKSDMLRQLHTPASTMHMDPRSASGRCNVPPSSSPPPIADDELRYSTPARPAAVEEKDDTIDEVSPPDRVINSPSTADDSTQVVASQAIDLTQHDTIDVSDGVLKENKSEAIFNAIAHLRPGCKLGDDTIYHIMQLFLLPGYQLVEGILPPTRAAKPWIRVKEKQIIIVLYRPKRCHWILAHLDLEQSVANLWDPVDIRYDSLIDEDMKLLRASLISSSWKVADEEVWRTIKHTVPHQNNTFDCGIFSLVFALHTMAQTELPERITGSLWRVIFTDALRESKADASSVASIMTPKTRDLCSGRKTAQSFDDHKRELQNCRLYLGEVHAVKELFIRIVSQLEGY